MNEKKRKKCQGKERKGEEDWKGSKGRYWYLYKHGMVWKK